MSINSLLTELPIKELIISRMIDDDPGYFVKMKFFGEMEVMFSVYDDNPEEAYTNVLFRKDIVFQGYLEYRNIIKALKNFFSTHQNT